MTPLLRQRAMVIEPERINRQIMVAVLDGMCDVLLAKSGEQALECLRRDAQVDVLLINVQMPGMDGYELMRHLKANPATRDIPVIFITGSSAVEQEELAFSLGAADFIVKPIRATTARARIALQLRLAQQFRQVEDLAQRDGLTSLSNRRRFDQLLKQEWQRCQRTSRPLSLIMMDVDHFKAFNDTAGHQQGDHVLRSVASALQETCARTGDLVARYGGEEFAVLLPETDATGGLQAAERLRAAVEALAIAHPKSTTSSSVTISLGGATSGHGQTTAEALLGEADEVLYQAKKGGRNRASWAEFGCA